MSHMKKNIVMKELKYFSKKLQINFKIRSYSLYLKVRLDLKPYSNQC